MEPLAGLYVAYEIVRGVATIAGANQAIVEFSDRLINIAKILQERSAAAQAPIGPVVEVPGTAGIQPQLDRLATLLMLLAHSEVKLDLGALRLSLSEAESPQRMDNLLFVSGDSERPIPLTEIPSLSSFTAFDHAQLRWDGQRRCMDIGGLTDRNVARLPGEFNVTLDRTCASREILITVDGTDRLRLVYVHSSRSQLLPIHWNAAAPLLEIWHGARGTHAGETLLAEILVLVTDEHRVENFHGR